MCDNGVRAGTSVRRIRCIAQLQPVERAERFELCVVVGARPPCSRRRRDQIERADHRFAGCPGEPDGLVGAESAGDPYYPDSGNGGYDAQSYAVAITYDPLTQAMSATTTIVAVAAPGERLGRFSFDLQPSMKVSDVQVNGAPAGAAQHDAKLQITPASGIDANSTMTVQVTYAGTPGRIVDGTGGIADGGWYVLDSGGAVAIGEPFSASAWYPVNETPRDRAMFSVQATVPDGWQVISNGQPVASGLPSAPPGQVVFGWSSDESMASYLTMIYIDKFTKTENTGPSGIPMINAYGPGAEQFQQAGEKVGEYLDFLATKFGAYPFRSGGGVFIEDSLGYALETQTRPVYAGFGDEETVVHENAHQWFGDAVTIESWADICLNECFASYAQWLWAEHNGIDLDDQYRTYLAQDITEPGMWQLPLVDMGAGNEFGDVYIRGPLALHALRNEIGDDKFAELLLSWIEENTGKNASWSQFEDLVDQVAGKDESAFIDAWFRKTGVPADEFLYPGDLHK